MLTVTPCRLVSFRISQTQDYQTRPNQNIKMELLNLKKKENIAFARGGAQLPIAHAIRLLSTQELRFGLTKLNLRKNNCLK